MQDSAKTMEQVWEVLQQHTKVSLLQLVLSHASFAQTVENLFALSMLVRTPWPYHIGPPMLSMCPCIPAEADAVSPGSRPGPALGFMLLCLCKALCKCGPQSVCCCLTTASPWDPVSPKSPTLGLAICR